VHLRFIGRFGIVAVDMREGLLMVHPRPDLCGAIGGGHGWGMMAPSLGRVQGSLGQGLRGAAAVDG
jgi:hypothetical protein